MTNLLS